ncbi:MAG: hypothetical protein COA70_13675 [Planctomycetota bacterium]|nr:MAG: hypothetical protein COA70_13675 [Planctomycetota bacterium]
MEKKIKDGTLGLFTGQSVWFGIAFIAVCMIGAAMTDWDFSVGFVMGGLQIGIGAERNRWIREAQKKETAL